MFSLETTDGFYTVLSEMIFFIVFIQKVLFCFVAPCVLYRPFNKLLRDSEIYVLEACVLIFTYNMENSKLTCEM